MYILSAGQTVTQKVSFHLAAVWIDRPEELWQGSLPSVAGSSQFVPFFLLPGR